MLPEVAKMSCTSVLNEHREAFRNDLTITHDTFRRKEGVKPLAPTRGQATGKLNP